MLMLASTSRAVFVSKKMGFLISIITVNSVHKNINISEWYIISITSQQIFQIIK